MSKREFDRLEVLTGVRAGRLRVADACTLLGLSRRQLFRLLKGIRVDGAASLVSKRRGQPSNRRLPAAVRELATALVRAHYRDFEPTLAAEKLAERHGCAVSRETLRQWMMADGMWADRRHRWRRDCLGELVQIVARCVRERTTAASTPGLRIPAPRARCWPTWTTRPAGSCCCASCRASRHRRSRKGGLATKQLAIV